jgi:hypothetical protein
MFLVLAVIVGIAWLMGFAVFHVAGGAIHVLLLIAIAAIIVHFVRARRPAWGE